MLDASRPVLIEFRGHTSRLDLAAGELGEVQLMGKAQERRARATKPDAVRV
jgi:hypothetical protein